MECSWPVTNLSTVATLRSGHPFRSADWLDRGVPVIKIANIKGGRVLREGCGYVSEEVAASVSQWMTRDGDVLIAMTGYVGEVALVRLGERFLVNQRVGRFEFREDSPVRPEFLFYYLQIPEVRATIEEMARGSAQPNLSARDASALIVPVPPKETQASIIEIGKSLDDRIDNLRETNATLEAIAQALFKSWFVDFDPVRAKAEGREPEGMDPATAALFPSEFEDSEYGPIPKGWQVDQIGKLVSCLGGTTPSTKDESFWQDGVHHWATPKDLSGLQSPVLVDTDRRITDAGLSKISSGLLPAGTLLLSSRAPIGYLAISAVPTAINQGFIAMPPGGELSPVFLLCWCKENMDLIKQSANGSTFMEISKKAFRPLSVCVPPAEIRDAFEQLASPIIDKITANEQHRHSLTELRDTLLPRLISGKLKISQAQERSVEAEE